MSFGGRHLGVLGAILEKTVDDIGKFIDSDPKRISDSSWRMREHAGLTEAAKR